VDLINPITHDELIEQAWDDALEEVFACGMTREESWELMIESYSKIMSAKQKENHDS
jgi:hypothetical protein